MPYELSLEGKVALVTGASRGLGKTMALALARAGADVALAARTLPDLERTAQEVRHLGRQALPLQVDLTDMGQIQGMVERTVARFGTVDILINNAGVASEKRVLEMTEEEWDRVMTINLKAPVFCAREVGKVMVARQRGKVINVSSIAGIFGQPTIAAYAASKAGLILFTKVLALEWARYNIQVNALAPGYFATAINEHFFATERGQEFIRHYIPARRIGDPSELEGAVVFLASEASNYMTGSVLIIDGGQSIM